MEAKQEVSELESEPAPSLPAPTSTWKSCHKLEGSPGGQIQRHCPSSGVPNLLGHTLFALEVLLQAPFAWLIAIFLSGS